MTNKGWQGYLQENYAKNVTDEFLEPMAFGDENGMFPRISDNDAIINFCYRATERQITKRLRKIFKVSSPQLKNIFMLG
jgi:bisphosphoglycerate-independent phosphoglycerate mutase (AlkP superfamily)